MIDIFFYFCLYSEARHYFHENFAPYDWSIFLKKALRLLPCGAVLIWSKAKQGQESLSTQSSVQKMWKLGKATNIGASQHLRNSSSRSWISLLNQTFMLLFTFKALSMFRIQGRRPDHGELKFKCMLRHQSQGSIASIMMVGNEKVAMTTCDMTRNL